MQEPLDAYANIQKLVQKEIDDKIAEYVEGARFSVAKIPVHAHTGVDSPNVDYKDLVGTPVASTSNYSVGTGTRTTGSGTGTQAITTGFLPKLIKIYAVADVNSSWVGESTGVATTITNSQCILRDYSAGGVWERGSSTSYIIFVWDTGAANYSRCSVSVIDSTSFTLNWTTVGVNVKFLYEVHG